MSRRRKTLCHAEIENFLSELQAEGSPNKQNPIGTIVKRDIDTFSVDAVPAVRTEEEMASDAHEDMRMQIRHFVKISFSLSNQKDAPEDALLLAKAVSETCSYNLLPMRMLKPDSFQHPSETIESKKAVLISLGPMLDIAEKQRKLDVSKCEEITRCRIESKKTRASWYQYSDLDSRVVIDPSEYEMRYVNFLTCMKQSRQADESNPDTSACPISNERGALNEISANTILISDTKMNATKRTVQKNQSVVVASEAHDNDENVVLADDLVLPDLSRREKVSYSRSDKNRRSSIKADMHGNKTERLSGRQNSSRGSIGRTASAEVFSKGKRETYAKIHMSPESSPNTKETKKLGERRRTTLSPGKMKAMLELALAENSGDDDDEFSECNSGPTPESSIVIYENSASESVDDKKFTVVLGNVVNSSDVTSIGQNCSDLVSQGGAESNFQLPEEFEYESPANDALEYKAIATVRKSIGIVESEGTLIEAAEVSKGHKIIVKKELLHVDSPTVKELANVNSGTKESLGEINEGSQTSLSPDFTPMDTGLDCPRDRARCRLYIRLEVARWKHGWEIASIDAADAAVRKFAKR